MAIVIKSREISLVPGLAPDSFLGIMYYSKGFKWRMDYYINSPYNKIKYTKYERW